MINSKYIETVRLLLDVAPYVFEEPRFALKGGTAINLFASEMPRLSVDLDVVYTDYERPRNQALADISAAMAQLRKRLINLGMTVADPASEGDEEVKLLVRRRSVSVKVEVNFVFRGTVLPVEKCTISKLVMETFQRELALPVLATAELYGSKLVAAMDRQHPRDLFDVQEMYARQGLTPEIVECFVAYLAGHNRPVHEVLFPRAKDISLAYASEFSGMPREPISLDVLLQARSRLIRELPLALERRHREFLQSLVRTTPDWSLMSCPHLSALPAIQWKLKNLNLLEKKSQDKFELQALELEKQFGPSN